MIALSTHSDQIYMIDMIKAGAAAAAYVTKAEGGKELLRAIEAIEAISTIFARPWPTSSHASCSA